MCHIRKPPYDGDSSQEEALGDNSISIWIAGEALTEHLRGLFILYTSLIFTHSLQLLNAYLDCTSKKALATNLIRRL